MGNDRLLILPSAIPAVQLYTSAKVKPECELLNHSEHIKFALLILLLSPNCYSYCKFTKSGPLFYNINNYPHTRRKNNQVNKVPFMTVLFLFQFNFHRQHITLGILPGSNKKYKKGGIRDCLTWNWDERIEKERDKRRREGRVAIVW